MKYTDVRNNPKKFLALTGVNIAFFDEILPWFEEEHDLYLRYHDITGKKRSGKRAGAIYSNSPLQPSSRNNLLYIHIADLLLLAGVIILANNRPPFICDIFRLIQKREISTNMNPSRMQ